MDRMTGAAWNRVRRRLPRKVQVVVSQVRGNAAPHLQAFKTKMARKPKPPAACQRCGLEDDDANHFLFRCPKLADIRAEYFGPAPTPLVMTYGALEVYRYANACSLQGHDQPLQ